MKILVILLSILIINISYGKMKISVSIGPIAYLVEQIGGKQVDIVTVIGDGKNPHIYSPSPKQIKDINNSKFYFAIGAPFESVLLKKVSASGGPRIINLDEKVKKRKMRGHHHDHDGEDDPHIWLSTKAIRIMVTRIFTILSKDMPEYIKEFDKNRNDFLKALNLTINDVQSLLKPLRGKKVFVFHPSFGYFLEENGLDQKAIELEGKSPSPKHVAAIIQEAKKDKIKVIFMQPQFSKKAAITIARGIGGKVESINALQRDILTNFKLMATTIKNAYE